MMNKMTAQSPHIIDDNGLVVVVQSVKDGVTLKISGPTFDVGAMAMTLLLVRDAIDAKGTPPFDGAFIGIDGGNINVTVRLDGDGPGVFWAKVTDVNAWCRCGHPDCRNPPPTIH